MSNPILPGLLVLHGNRLEDLRAAVFEWLKRYPLAPLEEAVFLVQSNSIAEWLKMSLAQETGICAATRVQLPSQFLWQCYRAALGRSAVPQVSPLDKAPLAWRLMRVLPTVLQQPGFEPLRHFLADGDPGRRYQLAEKLADLYDQYQVYRADWLADWAQGRDVMRPAAGPVIALDEGQRWQAALWRTLQDDVPAPWRATGRDGVHRRFVAAMQAGEQPVSELPRRVVLFGISALPQQTLEALSELARHAQVMLAVPNPCRFHWADIMEGRDLLRATRQRHAARGAQNLAEVDLADMHLHSNPLLAAWGRQGRDFVRMLDEFDDALAAQERFNTRIDFFSEPADDARAHGTPLPLLTRIQGQIRDLEPLPAAAEPLPAGDRSIVFQVSHSAQREVEILHDQLLQHFAASGSALTPRDVVVMVPDIETFAPAIRAVFGQYGARDARHIPYHIADQKNRDVNPVLKAMEWLLRLPEQRCRLSELRDLLDVPALARRFGLHEADLPRLAQWMEGAGVRWGLSQQQRAQLELAACGEQNTWLFGLRRMLLGYASGDGATFAGIEPYGEVGGLDAALAGSLAAVVEQLQSWSEQLRQPANPAVWSERGRALLEQMFDPRSEAERLTVIALETALQQWLEACDIADFDEAVTLPVLREAWLGHLDEPTLNQRFMAGGVTFCTLMPMRAIPFRIVCLLGMNDGDYPRRANRNDFDLLAGLYRPGDRSRRDDDRYLLLEAMLAARDQLYISYAGRNPRDNSEQPPSVLVAQLRDYIAAGWGETTLHALTIEHPLQPFSRRYFEGGALFTWAREWRAAHEAIAPVATASASSDWLPAADFRLALTLLARFLQNPVKSFFRQRLDVVFADADLASEDEEPFALNGLEQYQLVSELLAHLDPASTAPLADNIDAAAARIARSGRLPIGPLGQRETAQLAAQVTPVWQQWVSQIAAWPNAGSKQLLHFEHDGLTLEDWLDGLRQQGQQRAWLQLLSGTLCDKQGQPRADKLLLAWLRQLVASACGHPVMGIVVARDATLTLGQPERADAQAALQDLLTLWLAGMNAPLPVACRTALAFLTQATADAIGAYEGTHVTQGENAEPCLARTYPDYAALTADGRFAELAEALYGPLERWLSERVQVTLHSSAHDEETADV
ncbi:exodeoxyribonuclease V subunit gamma [Amantichitinum ursilacus]|uniref:RecBCD enzyme subunit RecC n=1 Tax=Amantichitinum ursilacus TaxID=857265 RepID=A0A0N0GLV9_9NEIS|nr:exodeoxyribonuclease V subunit gamma [Amantichitinum ursilacus]KPC50289.1 RecBCD enzyme subunit RecC [Amantichitinum ursilacus]